MNESAVGIGVRIREVIKITALGIEMLAVVIIVVAVVHGTIRYLIHRKGIHPGDAFSSYKVQLGKALLVGLVLLVAADIVRTVALNPTLVDVAILGFLVLIRTFLSWSLVVEIEGRWPLEQGSETGCPKTRGTGMSLQALVVLGLKAVIILVVLEVGSWLTTGRCSLPLPKTGAAASRHPGVAIGIALGNSLSKS